MKKIKLPAGAFVVFHGRTFFPRGIQLWMNIKRWLKLEFKPVWKLIFNHAGLMVSSNKLCEAAAHGIQNKEINEAYKKSKYQLIYAYEYDWSEEQIALMDQLTREWEGRRYQYVNFLQWIINILTFGLVWIGKKGAKADKTFYCYESAITQVYHATGPGYAKNDRDRQLHERLKNLYHQPSPLFGMKICKEFFTLKHIYILEKGVVVKYYNFL